MIRFFEEKDKNAVVALWQEAFGEKKEEILPFLDFINKDMLLIEEKGQIISMLSLLKVKIGDVCGRYVYAVATDKRFRGKGYATELLDFAKGLVAAGKETFLVILPRNESLYAFYGKSGFTPLCCAKRISRKISAETSYSVEKITSESYFELKKTYFSGEKYVEFDIKTLEFMQKAYCGEFLKAEKDGKTAGLAFCHKYADLLVIHELLAGDSTMEIIDAMGVFSGAGRAECIKAEREGGNFGMIYPPEYNDVYFGLGMQ